MDQAELLRSLTALLDAGRWEDAYIWFWEHQNAFIVMMCRDTTH